MNPYEVLGVAKTASLKEIKDAYRKLAKANHPDAGGDAAKFKDIKDAYDVLSDDEARAHYDATGEVNQVSIMREFDELIAVTIQHVVRTGQGCVTKIMRESIKHRIEDLQEQRNRCKSDMAGLIKARKKFAKKNDKGEATDPIAKAVLESFDVGIEVRASEITRFDGLIERAKRAFDKLDGLEETIAERKEVLYEMQSGTPIQFYTNRWE